MLTYEQFHRQNWQTQIIPTTILQIASKLSNVMYCRIKLRTRNSEYENEFGGNTRYEHMLNVSISFMLTSACQSCD